MSNKLTLIINSEAQADDSKTAAFPRRRTRRLGRRRGESAIEFYDLGQVSGDGVTFTDHPLLKVPSYSVSFEVSSPGDFDGTALYTMESFGDADYQAYTDMMFDIPLEEWHWRYKRLEYEPIDDTSGTTVYTDYPSHITLRDKNGTMGKVMRSHPDEVAVPGVTTDFMIDASLHSTPDAYARQMLSALGLTWWQTPVGKMKNRGLTELETAETLASANRGPSFYPFSTSNKADYKVTATNDPDAPDVGTIAPGGLTRIFMMPQIVAWAAVASSTDLQTKYVLGPVYQITPRRKWPRYEDKGWLHSDGSYSVGLASCFGVIDDPDDRKKDFLEWQMARGGMQASSFSRSGPFFADCVFNGAMSPTIWPSTGDNYASQTFTTSDTEGLFDFGGSSNPYRGDTSFTTGSSPFLVNTQPMLTAVIQKGSNYYYVWKLEMLDNHTRQQGDKYILTLRQDSVGVGLNDDASAFALS